MKTKVELASWFLGICFLATPAMANHQGGTPLETLRLESEELNQLVQYSNLRNSVKSTVYQFTVDVQRLDGCARGGEEFLSEGVSRDHDHAPGVIPQQCRFALQHARQTFSMVDRYLYDTNYDYRDVYASYVDTRNALFSIR